MGAGGRPVGSVGGARLEGSGRRGAEALTLRDPDGELGQAILQATRLKLLAILASDLAEARNGLSLQELRELLSCSTQNVHHHLRILVEAGVAYPTRSEGTHSAARQFWRSDVRQLRVEVPVDDGRATLDVELRALQRR